MTKRDGAGVVGVGVAACAVCCAGPILAFLGAMGSRPLSAWAIFGVVGVLGALLAVPVFLRRRRRPLRRSLCGSRSPWRHRQSAHRLNARPTGWAHRGRVAGAGGGLFVLGDTIERGDRHDEPAAATTALSGEQTGHDEGTEAAGGHGESSTQPAVEGSEKVLGLDVESPALVALGVGVSLVLAALAWLRPQRAVFVVVAAFAAAFAVLDVAETLHQIDKSRTGLAVVASVLALVHLLTALRVSRRSRLRRGRPSADRTSRARLTQTRARPGVAARPAWGCRSTRRAGASQAGQRSCRRARLACGPSRTEPATTVCTRRVRLRQAPIEHGADIALRSWLGAARSPGSGLIVQGRAHVGVAGA